MSAGRSHRLAAPGWLRPAGGGAWRAPGSRCAAAPPRFDKFNLKYNPFGQSRLREIFIKQARALGVPRAAGRPASCQGGWSGRVGSAGPRAQRCCCAALQDNLIHGRFLAELTREVFADLEASKYQHTGG